MITRLVAALLPVLLSGLGIVRPAPAPADGGRADGRVVSHASVLLAHRSPDVALTWLRQQPAVSSAVVGADRKTVDIQFRDGIQGAILPSARTSVPVASRAIPRLHPHQAGSEGRALVLEPFATQLYLGANAGDAEASALESAGFTVDRASDEAVTVQTMTQLPRYNVVYMLTHSGVNTAGEGVIATGEVANGDPSVQPFLDDHTVLIVGVVGSALKFYGVLSGFFRDHVSDFPRGSLVFVNGCSILRASLVWKALAARNVSTMVSWDNEAMQKDDTVASALFFDSMARGKTVQSSLADVYAAGHGRSTVDGTVASIGYLGADVSLRDVLSPPSPTPIPTETSLPTSTPPPTPLPTIGPSPARSPTHASTTWHHWPRPLPLRTALAAGAHP